MSRTWIRALTLTLALFGVVFLQDTVVTQASNAPHSTPTPTPLASRLELPRREAPGEAESPTISFIDSPNPACYRPVAG